MAQINALQPCVRAQPGAAAAQHSATVVDMLKGKLADVSVGFREVLEVRTQNIQASRARTDKFVADVRPPSPPTTRESKSSLYQMAGQQQQQQQNPEEVLLTIEEPAASSGQQMALMEQGGQGSYIHARGEAIETIERTISELGRIFGQLAQMVGEQGNTIQRIDQDTDDVVTNIEGGQRELLKYFSRISSNRWLMAKMFGVLMIFFLLWVLVS